MKLKDLIGKQVVRTKPQELPGGNKGFWNFSYMDSPIEILDVGEKYIFYKNVYSEDSWIRKDPKFSDYHNKIEKMDISSDDNHWIEFKKENKNKYRSNMCRWQDLYQKKHPNEIRLMRQAY